MKKEQIQKMVLGAIFVLAALYAYFSMMLGPLATKEQNVLKAIAKLEPQIKEAEKQVNRTRAVEAADLNAATARELREVMDATIPKGASVAWFPQKLSEFFKRQGIDKAVYRLASEKPDPELPDFNASSWIIEIPRVEFIPLATAIAGLENQEGLAQITNVQIDTAPTEVRFQRVRISLTTLVK